MEESPPCSRRNKNVLEWCGAPPPDAIASGGEACSVTPLRPSGLWLSAQKWPSHIRPWLLRCSLWKWILALLLFHGVFMRVVNHRPFFCPHHHSDSGMDLHVVHKTTAEETQVRLTAETEFAQVTGDQPQHYHPSSDILYSVAVEEEWDLLGQDGTAGGDGHSHADEHLVVQSVWYATVGGPLYGYALSRHANYHLVDEYSISHVTHGVLAALVAHVLAAYALRRHRFLCAFLYKHGLLLAVSFETVWELAENWPSNVNCYDSKGMKYCGDDWLNSVGDILCMACGYLLFHHVMQALKAVYTRPRAHASTIALPKRLRHALTSPVCVATPIVLLLECLMFWLIRDCLLCSMLQFFLVKLTHTTPGVLLRLQEQRLPMLLTPLVVRCP